MRATVADVTHIDISDKWINVRREEPPLHTSTRASHQVELHGWFLVVVYGSALTPELASFSEGRGPAQKDHRRAGFPCVPGGRGVPCGVPWTVVGSWRVACCLAIRGVGFTYVPPAVRTFAVHSCSS